MVNTVTQTQVQTVPAAPHLCVSVPAEKLIAHLQLNENLLPTKVYEQHVESYFRSLFKDAPAQLTTLTPLQSWAHTGILESAKGFAEAKQPEKQKLINAEVLAKDVGFANAFALLSRGYQIAYRYSISSTGEQQLQTKNALNLFKNELLALVKASPVEYAKVDLNAVKFNEKAGVSAEFLAQLNAKQVKNSRVEMAKAAAAGFSVLVAGAVGFINRNVEKFTETVVSHTSPLADQLQANATAMASTLSKTVAEMAPSMTETVTAGAGFTAAVASAMTAASASAPTVLNVVANTVVAAATEAVVANVATLPQNATFAGMISSEMLFAAKDVAVSSAQAAFDVGLAQSKVMLASAATFVSQIDPQAATYVAGAAAVGLLTVGLVAYTIKKCRAPKLPAQVVSAAQVAPAAPKTPARVSIQAKPVAAPMSQSVASAKKGEPSPVMSPGKMSPVVFMPAVPMSEGFEAPVQEEQVEQKLAFDEDEASPALANQDEGFSQIEGEEGVASAALPSFESEDEVDDNVSAFSAASAASAALLSTPVRGASSLSIGSPAFLSPDRIAFNNFIAARQVRINAALNAAIRKIGNEIEILKKGLSSKLLTDDDALAILNEPIFGASKIDRLTKAVYLSYLLKERNKVTGDVATSDFIILSPQRNNLASPSTINKNRQILPGQFREIYEKMDVMADEFHNALRMDFSIKKIDDVAVLEQVMRFFTLFKLQIERKIYQLENGKSATEVAAFASLLQELKQDLTVAETWIRNSGTHFEHLPALLEKYKDIAFVYVREESKAEHKNSFAAMKSRAVEKAFDKVFNAGQENLEIASGASTPRLSRSGSFHSELSQAVSSHSARKSMGSVKMLGSSASQSAKLDSRRKSMYVKIAAGK